MHLPNAHELAKRKVYIENLSFLPFSHILSDQANPNWAWTFLVALIKLDFNFEKNIKSDTFTLIANNISLVAS